MTFVALYVVFSGFFAERRLNDRLEDLEGRARTGKRTLQMATLRRAEQKSRLPTLDKLLWQWFPNASKIRQKLQTSGMNVTLGDFAFASIALAVGWPSRSTCSSTCRRAWSWSARCWSASASPTFSSASRPRSAAVNSISCSPRRST